MHEDAPALGDTIRELRCALGWSQGRLAAELREVSARPTVTREDVSRWEHGRRVPRPFWIRHLAAVLQVPQWALEGCVQRRDMLKLAGAVAGSAVLGIPSYAAGEELYSSIAAGDDIPLARVQTSHETDLMLAGLAGADRPVMLRLARWADDGGSDVLRVNAAGILAKTRSLDSAGLAAAALRRDREMRLCYLRAVSARVGGGNTSARRRAGQPRRRGGALVLGLDAQPRQQPAGAAGPGRCAADRARGREHPLYRHDPEWRRPMLVIEVRDCELLSSLEQAAQREGIRNAAIVTLIGAVDSFTVSTMPASDATKDVLTDYDLPAEMTATGEIVDGKPHIHAVMAVEGDRAIAGHVHRAQIGTWFARAYVTAL